MLFLGRGACVLFLGIKGYVHGRLPSSAFLRNSQKDFRVCTSAMGSIVSKGMEENFRKSQEFSAEMSNIMIERQLQMQDQMRERMTASQIARARELLYWFGSFYVIAALGMVAGFRRTKKPGVLAPLLPLTFVGAYQVDMAFGNKIRRLRAEAENIMKFERDLLELPHGLPTRSSIDQARLSTDEK